MKKVLFIDRDGTLVDEPSGDYQLDSFGKLRFKEGVIVQLAKIVQEMDYELAMVTNQDGMGTESFPAKDFWAVQDFIVNHLKSEGIEFEDIYIDSSYEKDNSPHRKPNIGMLGKYLRTNKYDLENSWVIGDRSTDILLAKNLNCKSIYLKNSQHSQSIEPTLEAKNWKEIYSHLKQLDRRAKVKRTTYETDIDIAINIDGEGVGKIDTGLPFFDHMLEQLTKHGNLDLWINAKGDTHIDEHHSIEDVGIALGRAFVLSLGSKIGIERYGFSLPMDEADASVLIDFGGRADLVWKAYFFREKVGDVATEMFSHFFKSFCSSAQCNLNISAQGENEHHKIEAIFKAFAKAIKMAVTQDKNSSSLPSSKGVL